MAGLVEGAGRDQRLARGGEILLLDVLNDLAGDLVKLDMQLAGRGVVLGRQHPARLVVEPVSELAGMGLTDGGQIHRRPATQEIPELGFPCAMDVDGILAVRKI